MFWRILSLVAVAAATATLFGARRRPLATAHPEALSRWEDEGGNVPQANLSQQGAESDD